MLVVHGHAPEHRHGAATLLNGTHTPLPWRWVYDPSNPNRSRQAIVDIEGGTMRAAWHPKKCSRREADGSGWRGKAKRKRWCVQSWIRRHGIRKAGLLASRTGRAPSPHCTSNTRPARGTGGPQKDHMGNLAHLDKQGYPSTASDHLVARALARSACPDSHNACRLTASIRPSKRTPVLLADAGGTATTRDWRACWSARTPPCTRTKSVAATDATCEESPL